MKPHKRPGRTKPLATVLERKSIPVTDCGCWMWTEAINYFGYGKLRHNHRDYLAHRASWLAFRGDPGNMHVLHKCNTPACINPDHLYLGTDLDNTRDRIAAGTQINWGRVV